MACHFVCICRWKEICCLLTSLSRPHRSGTYCLVLDCALCKTYSNDWLQSKKEQPALTSTCWKISSLWPPGRSRAVLMHSQATCGTWTMKFRWKKFDLDSKEKLQIKTPVPLRNELHSTGLLGCLKVTLGYISTKSLLELTSDWSFLPPFQCVRVNEASKHHHNSWWSCSHPWQLFFFFLL